jgi:Post-segregation antitoxin CcdA
MRDEKRNSTSTPLEAPKHDVRLPKAEADIVLSQNMNAKAWKSDNRDAIQAINDWVEVNGIPLSEFRQF